MDDDPKIVATFRVRGQSYDEMVTDARAQAAGFLGPDRPYRLVLSDAEPTHHQSEQWVAVATIHYPAMSGF